MNYIFIDSNEETDKIGLVEEDRLLEIYIDEKNKVNIGEIYRGRVQSVVRGLNSAFIDIGKDKNAYLSFKDLAICQEDPSKDLVENQCLIVQVEKEGSQDKGPKVTNKIEISGSNMVLTPYLDQIRISRKIKDKKEGARLLQIAKEISEENYGLIFRTSSKGLSLDEIQEEYENLLGQFNKIEQEKNFLPCPKLIYTELKDWEKILLDRLEDLDKIIVNTREKYDQVAQLLSQHSRSSDKLSLEDYRLDYDLCAYPFITKALKRKISLNSGASIVIDELEALTAIDINTQAVKKDRSFRKNIVKVNLDSAKKIAQEIRLRNISGIILIDFINMDRQEDRDQVRARLIQELAKDPIEAYVYDYTKLGLLEMSRAKKRNSLKNTWKAVEIDEDKVKNC